MIVFNVAMQSRTEEFLYQFLWVSGQLMCPSFRNLTESFEGWAYRNRLLRRVRYLEASHLLERKPDAKTVERIYRLSTAGWLAALGGRDPVQAWNQTWNGEWQLVMFDISKENNSARNRLRRWLIREGFGYFQDSVWISPHSPSENLQLLWAGIKGESNTLVAMKARLSKGMADAEVVAASWDFEEINQLWRREIQILAACPDSRNIGELQDWLKVEREAWLQALEVDPLLPRSLWPAGYLGKEAWKRRCIVAERVGQRGAAV